MQEIINIHTIKPLDEKAILESVGIKTKCVVSAEEHMLNGGLGDSIAYQCLSRNNPTPIEMVGVNDTFGESGKPKELMAKYGLDSNKIVKAALKLSKKINIQQGKMYFQTSSPNYTLCKWNGNFC